MVKIMDGIIELSDEEDNGDDLEAELQALEGHLHQVCSNAYNGAPLQSRL